MIGAVLALDWRMIAGDLPAARRVDVRKVGTWDHFVGEHISGNRLAAASDHQAIRLLLDRKLRLGGAATCSSAKQK